jgi:hypothetical protein
MKSVLPALSSLLLASLLLCPLRSAAIDPGTAPSASAESRTLDYRVEFSAPLFSEPAITADLKGKAAQDSPQVRLLRERVRAFSKGDFGVVHKLSTPRASEHFAAFGEAGPQARSFAKEAAADMDKSLRAVQHVVVRGDRAVVIYGNKEWSNLVRLGGDWRSDD